MVMGFTRDQGSHAAIFLTTDTKIDLDLHSPSFGESNHGFVGLRRFASCSFTFQSRVSQDRSTGSGVISSPVIERVDQIVGCLFHKQSSVAYQKLSAWGASIRRHYQSHCGSLHLCLVSAAAPRTAPVVRVAFFLLLCCGSASSFVVPHQRHGGTMTTTIRTASSASSSNNASGSNNKQEEDSALEDNKSISIRDKKHKPHLVLHFDINETILIGDEAGGDTREDCLNKMLAKSAFVRVPESSSTAAAAIHNKHELGTCVPTHWWNGTPIREDYSNDDNDNSTSAHGLDLARRMLSLL